MWKKNIKNTKRMSNVIWEIYIIEDWTSWRRRKRGKGKMVEKRGVKKGLKESFFSFIIIFSITSWSWWFWFLREWKMKEWRMGLVSMRFVGCFRFWFDLISFSFSSSTHQIIVYEWSFHSRGYSHSSNSKNPKEIQRFKD